MTSHRITIVASELLGNPGTGGAGTADSLLAVALGRHGHRIRLLVASGRPIAPISPEWARVYRSAGVEVRVLEGMRGVRPSYLAPSFEVFQALREEPPEIAIANDWRGLGYLALRARQLGLALSSTAFVVHCHGPARVLAEFARKVPDTLARFGEEVGERASVELADAVVSPSRWLLDWMRAHHWPVPPAATVIPYVRQAAALAEPLPLAPTGSAVRRVAFFGQLREGKGIRVFLAALQTVDPALLDGVELVFLGRETARWTSKEIAASISSRVQERLLGVRFETHLDRDSALALLREPGTLAVMPSLLDNSPNTVSECIEHGIPFIAAHTGGIPELVAEEDRDRVLFRPTVTDLAAVLTRALESRPGFLPGRAAHEPGESLTAWLDLVEAVESPRSAPARAITGVAVVATGEQATVRAHRLAEQSESVQVEVVAAASRAAGVARTSADWVVFLDDEDVPEDGMLDALIRAQAASGADAVTAAVRPGEDPDAIQLFLGDPGALGLIENQYGVLGLVRRSLAGAQPSSDGGVDPDWPLFVHLALTGARIVSLPDVFSTHRGRPGRVGDVPGEGLAILRLFEEADAGSLPDLSQLAATLAAAHARLESRSQTAPPQHIVRRALGVLQADGVGGFARRAGARVQALLSSERRH